MINIKRILCPIDFSEFSRRALDYAIAIARRQGSSVSVLHVYRAMMPAVAVGFGAETVQPVFLTAIDREQLVADMNQFVEAGCAPGVDIHVVLREANDVYREIVSQAEALPADLLVMGTHGRSGFEHLMLGSITEKVLRKAICPVLTVPRRMPDAVPATAGIFRRILCPVDFSGPATRALSYAVSLAIESGARLTVQHVMEFVPEAHEPFIDVSWREAGYRREYEQRSHEHLRAVLPEAARSCQVEDVVSAGKAYREILRLAAEQESDLIVIGVHGRNVIDRMFFGSTTQHVVRQATCPVLTLRAESSGGL